MNLFIDTNVFLSFFHLSSDDLEEIHKLAVLIDKGEVTLWLTEQIKDEFKRNREAKIADATKRLREQKSKGQFPQICKDYEEYSQIRDLQNDYNKALSSLIDKVNEDITKRTLKADEKIDELFTKARVIPTTEELVAKARFRMDVRNPPGKDGSLGDAINWEALLGSVEDGEKLYLVADDKDYYSVLDDTKLKDFLIDEWEERKNSDVYFYRRLSQFFKEYYPDIKLASELEKELAIRSLSRSGNFHATHNAISKLDKYVEFNKSQVNELAQICATNNQVGWILEDDDVYDFYKSLVDNYSEHIDKELLERLSNKLDRAEKIREESA